MTRIVTLSLIVLAAASLGACGPRAGLFADRSIAIVAPTASAGEAPRYVGDWAQSSDQCRHPWVIEAKSLKAGGSDCEFDKVDSSSAGYAVNAVCHSPSGPTPVRLILVTPNQARISTLTVSGGPFKDAVPLERCPAQ